MVTEPRFFARAGDGFLEQKPPMTKTAYVEVYSAIDAWIVDHAGDCRHASARDYLTLCLTGVQTGTWYELSREDAEALPLRRPVPPDQPSTGAGAW